MLAAPNDFGYTPAAHHHAMGGYDQHHHQQSGERPKLFLDAHNGAHMHGVHHPGMGDYMVNGHAAMTPQHHHQGGDFDHEPLMMNMHNPQSHFYPAMGQQMLHVSTDYASSMDGTTPSGRNNSKRSREDLNLKEKKRMFKLNDRINQLKVILDEAGVQSKKNKQSILDNTYHYVGMLRSNLLIAKQKAERAEKQAEAFRNQAQKGGNSEADSMFKRCFQQSTTPRLLVDLNLEPVLYNAAFMHHTGLNEEDIKGQSLALQSSLCLNTNKLEALVKICKEGKSMTMLTQARTNAGISSVTLIASPMLDDTGKVSNIEFTLVPLDTDMPMYKVKGEGQDSNASGVDLAL